MDAVALILASVTPMPTAVPTRRTAGIDPAKTLHYELDNSFSKDKPAYAVALAGDRVLSHRIGDVGRKDLINHHHGNNKAITVPTED